MQKMLAGFGHQLEETEVKIEDIFAGKVDEEP